jgi:hypothetical protein
MGLKSGEYIKYWSSNSSSASVMFAGTNLGLLKTVDKGTTWTRVASFAEESIGTYIDQNSSTKRIYHATVSKIYISDDSGATFQVYYTPTSLAIRQFALGSDANGLTLAFGDNDGTNACNWANGFLNTYGQTSVTNTVSNCGYLWVNKGSGFAKTAQAIGDHLKMAENDSSTVYTTGSKSWLNGYGTKVFVSKDKGSTFTLKLHQYNWDVIPYASWSPTKIDYSAVALDIGWWDSGYESFAINQKDSNQVAGTGYFFLHSSVNGGDNWKAPFTKYLGAQSVPTQKDKWNSRGLEVTSVYKVEFHPTNSNLMYAPMADLGAVISEDHGTSLRLAGANYNSIYDFAFNVNDDQVVYAAEGDRHDFPNDWYAQVYTGTGGIFKSIDRGRNWTRLTPDNTTFNRQYLSVAYDTSRDTIYAGTQEIGMVRSTDGGATWSQFNSGLPSATANVIPQIEVDSSTGNVYALLSGNSPSFTNQASTGIYFLDVQNGSTTWKLLRGTVTPAGGATSSQVWYFPTAFAVDFKNPGTMYLADYENNGNWLMTGIWKTTNNGSTWTRVQQVTHPTEIKIDPTDSNKIYVASYYELTGQWGIGGQLTSINGGSTWTKNVLPAYQANARGVTVDPTDSTQIYYSYFGSGILRGPNPAY